MSSNNDSRTNDGGMRVPACEITPAPDGHVLTFLEPDSHYCCDDDDCRSNTVTYRGRCSCGLEFYGTEDNDVTWDYERHCEALA